MFFDKPEEIGEIARKNGASVFVMPKNIKVEIKNAIILQPEEKAVITIDQVKDMIKKLGMKQTSDVYVLIRPAELLGLEASNALLKSLEEPGEKVHFVLVTDAPSRILPTIMSRAFVYFMRETKAIDGDIDTTPKTKELAKRLLVVNGADLVQLAEEIGKSGDGVREYALEVLGVSIEMIYKSYFITGKNVFLKRLPKFLKAYEGIAQNGNIKLQIVANLC